MRHAPSLLPLIASVCLLNFAPQASLAQDKVRPPASWKLDLFRVFCVLPYPVDQRVEIQGQFDQKPQPVVVQELTHFAVPVAKGAEAIKNKQAHFVWYRIEQPAEEPRRLIEVENQFGRQRLTLGQACFLLAPAEHKGSASSAPQGIDHFKVYEVCAEKCQRSIGAQACRLQDQYDEEMKVDVLVPRYFAVPVHKSHAGKQTAVQNPDEHLTIYEVRATKDSPVPDPRGDVQVEDQFGPHTLMLGESNLLCVPSRKRVIQPPAGLDHFQAHAVAGIPVEQTVRLQGPFDELSIPTTVTRLTHLATPVGVHGRDILDPNAFLTWYQIEEFAAEPVRTVRIWNEFGEQELSLGAAKYLLVPSRPTQADEKPTHLDHFKCFVVLTSCCTSPHQVKLTDRDGTVSAVEAQPPTLFCIPVAKTHAEKTSPIRSAGNYLTFYPIAPHPHSAKIRIRDQFVTNELTVGPRQLLGVPTLRFEVFPPITRYTPRGPN